MSDATPRRGPRWGTIIAAGSVAVVTALVVTLATIWPGFDAQQTPLDDGTLWAVQTGSDDGYARVNLELRELDTVKTAENASSVAQTGDRLFVFADGDSQFADVNMATPTDLTATTEDAFTRTPAGTVQVASAGDFLAFRTDAGAVSVATLSGGGDATTIDPYAGVEVDEGEERPRFVADATAIDADGVVYLYSSAESRVVRADATTGRILGEDTLETAPATGQLTAVGGRWALLDDASGGLWMSGRDQPVITGTGTGALLQRSALTDGDVYIADAEGLVRVPFDGGAAERIVDDVAGAPAAPTVQNGVTYAAWLGDDSGSLWTSDAPAAVTLDYAEGALGDVVSPVFLTNGSRIALNESTSGWVWTVPDGELIASSQQWELEETIDESPDDDAPAERVLDPKPPIAEDDEFGVRAGTVSLAQVLLNDHDPNEDVLSVDPGSITGLDPTFGTVSVSSADQTLVVDVAPDATGSATFQYRVTDGTSADGLYSNPATVTLTVVPDDTNRAPMRCEDCLVENLRPTVIPGGTVTVDALEGWIDPDGDPIYLSAVTNETQVGTAAGQPDGTVTYQHPDPQATEAVDVTLGFTVTDARGESGQGSMTVEVTPAPELTADSFAITGVAGTPLQIDVGDHISGSAGTPQLVGAVALNDSSATVTPNAAALTIDFSVDAPGSTLVQYTVRDDSGEKSGIARVTMRDPDDARISTPPLTAFVHPSEDATVDVFPAVDNPAGLVLLLSDLRPESAADATMSVDLVGQSLLRVSGSTDDGNPGTLGVVRYTVSDGSGADGASAQGELTVILLDASESAPPIAVDDAVTVRAGSQIDIPALVNDSAPAGSLFSIDPSKIVNENKAGLAFATSRVVRYLAPDEPGTYAVGYTIFRLGFPDATDSARIVITVVGDDANRAPQPRTLEGRVLSGQSVRIPFDSYGIDPDGDAVTLDRVLTQPAEGGSATISAEGDAIIYTSPDQFSGQDAFTYQVRDAEGAVGSARVRVGVLTAESDPSPVTFSDYIQIQVGEDNEAVVRPTDNDLDPAGGTLTLESVVPNAPEGTDEYDTLADLVDEPDEGQVTIRAGETPGTSSYIYTVSNATGDTAMGLIVVKAVDSPVPDYPVVADTTLTLESRESFPQGIDVLTGKVSWNAGDVSDLDLSLWGAPEGVTARGWEISGAIPEDPLLIPFEVTGTGFDGAEVVTYGFLRVPGAQDVRLALRDDATQIDVRENESADLNLASVIAIPSDRTLQIDADGVRAGGARANATCALTSGTTIRYTAGADAPWTDTCIVPVRLDGQDDDTFLTIRVVVEAEDPEPILRSSSITVSPGQTTTYDVEQMVSWAGREDWNALQFAESYRGDQFEVSLSGRTLTVTADDSARPGREEAATITLPSHPDATAAAVNLTVGPAPTQLPKGGTASQQCSQSGGNTSCTITVIGTGGEVNPLPGTPLVLSSVSSPANCPSVRFARASDTTVRATWSSDTPGAADCTAAFVVTDAQGRSSAGDRNGTILLDLQGLPAAPTRLDWIGFSEDSVTLRVIASTSSYPAVEGFRITADDRTVATCSASGDCPSIPATAGEKVSYEAHAVNSVGASRSGVRVTAWAYAAPDAPTNASATPVPNGASGGVANITVTGIDPSTGSLTLSGGADGEVTRSVSGSSVTFTGYNVGSNSPTSLTVTPITRFDLPPIPGGSQTGSSYTFRASGIGAPTVTIDVAASTSGQAQVTAKATVTPNGLGDRMLVGFSTGDSCTADQSLSAAGGTATVTLPAEMWTSMRVRACARTVLADVAFPQTTTDQSAAVTPTDNVPTPTGRATYSIGSQYSTSNNVYSWGSVSTTPNLRTTWPFEVRYRLGDSESTDFASLLDGRWGELGALTAASCSSRFGCGASIPVTASGPSYKTRVTFPTSCESDAGGSQPPASSVVVTANPSDWAVTRAESTDGSGVLTLSYTVTWKGSLTGLNSATYSLTCAPPTPPEPEPDPEPDPGTEG